MKRRASIACAGLLVVLVAGCSESTDPLGSRSIDPSSPESTEQSIAEIQASLPEEKRQEFSEALAVVIPNALGGGYREVGDTPEGRQRVREALRSKTADQIIAAAAQIRQENAARQAKPN